MASKKKRASDSDTCGHVNLLMRPLQSDVTTVKLRRKEGVRQGDREDHDAKKILHTVRAVVSDDEGLPVRWTIRQLCCLGSWSTNQSSGACWSTPSQMASASAASLTSAARTASTSWPAAQRRPMIRPGAGIDPNQARGALEERRDVRAHQLNGE